jgi:hypothetical protein
MTKRNLRLIAAALGLGAALLISWTAYLEHFMPPDKLHWATFPNIMVVIGLAFASAMTGALSGN